MAVLGPCITCRRHVRVDASSCPFCGAELALERAAPSGFGRMSRAAMIAGAVVAGGCHTPAAPVYGGPPTPVEPTVSDAAAPATSSATPSATPPVMPPAAAYGSPPTPTVAPK
jgi:hypothetical protein